MIISWQTWSVGLLSLCVLLTRPVALSTLKFSAGGPDDRVSKISEELELSPFEFSPGGPGFNFPGLFSF